MNAFDEWCFDDVPALRAEHGKYWVSVERTGEVHWCSFNSNPAYFCVEAVVQGFEEFMRDGAPVPVAPDVTAEVRDHLLAHRRPGRSTYVTFTLELPSTERFSRGYDWCIDGAPIRRPQAPGPSSAGAVETLRLGWRRTVGAAWERLLVAPGAHRLSKELWLDGEDKSERHRIVTHDFTLRAGERLELRLRQHREFRSPSGG